MDEAGDDLLAGSGLATNQHAGVGIGDAVMQSQHRLHGRVLADDGGVGRVLRASALRARVDGAAKNLRQVEA